MKDLTQRYDFDPEELADTAKMFEEPNYEKDLVQEQEGYAVKLTKAQREAAIHNNRRHRGLSDRRCRWCGRLLPLRKREYHDKCREIRDRLNGGG